MLHGETSPHAVRCAKTFPAQRTMPLCTLCMCVWFRRGVHPYQLPFCWVSVERAHAHLSCVVRTISHARNVCILAMIISCDGPSGHICLGDQHRSLMRPTGRLRSDFVKSTFSVVLLHSSAGHNFILHSINTHQSGDFVMYALTSTSCR